MQTFINYKNYTAMKKTYISPDIKARNVYHTAILTGSPRLSVNSDVTEGEGDWGDAQSKSFSSDFDEDFDADF